MSEGGKISFSERDRRRREKKKMNGGEGRPRGAQAQGRARAAASRYRQRIDEKLFGKKGDAARARLEQRLRDAQGSPDFGRTFREYVKGHGMPEDIGLLMLLLDLEAERDVLQVMRALDSAAQSAPLEQRNLLRSRLRNLEMSTSSDALADAAIDLLTRL